MRLLTWLDPGAPNDVAEREGFQQLRQREFGRLDDGRHVYLDYTGSGLYAQSQIDRHREFLDNNLLGNPHSENPVSALSTLVIDHARQEVLSFFHADPETYAVIFTGNASAAIKLVGEAFPFDRASRLVLLQDNHNSVNGLRRFAAAAGGEVCYLPVGSDLRLEPDISLPPVGMGASLLAFPGQSNFSGVRHPLALAAQARDEGYRTLLDAAALVPTSRLDLAATPVDFVCLSFYKMFGFPTGVGALVARRDALAHLRRPWFAGGTVDYVSTQHGLHQFRTGPDAFEDGTPNFQGIAGVPVGLGFLRSVGIDAVHRHVDRLTGRLIDCLRRVRYPDGTPGVTVYGPGQGADRGGTVAFNVLDPQGRPRPYLDLERAAGKQGIHLRGGCFCNPGAAEAAFGFPAGPVKECLQGLGPGQFGVDRLAACLGGDIAVGALRASLGIASDDKDIDALGRFLDEVVAGAPV